MTEHPRLASRPGLIRSRLPLSRHLSALTLILACMMPGSWLGAPQLGAQESPMVAPTYPVDDEPESGIPEPPAPEPGKTGAEKSETPTVAAPSLPTAKYSIIVAPLPPLRPFALAPAAPARTETAKAEPLPPGEKQAPPIAQPGAVPEPSIAAPRPVEPLVIETEPNMQIASLTITTQPATTEEIEAEEEKTPEPMIVEKQTDAVNIVCIQPEVFRLIRQAGEHFGETPVITSGQRDRGRRGSFHRRCMAADFFVPGIERARLAKYLRTLPGAGGVGTYCHTKAVHIDLGEPRNWYQCGRRFRFAQR